jgi:hypothetical protein
LAEGTKGRGRYPKGVVDTKGTDRAEMAKIRWERERAKAADRSNQVAAGPRTGRTPPAQRARRDATR